MKKPMFLTTLLLLCVAAVDCICPFPRECVENVRDFPVPCCPLYRDSRCGIDEGRGSCVMVKTSRTEPPRDILTDERLRFSEFFFNWTCQCKANFMGHNCGECSFGWDGDRCDVRKMVKRRNILDFSAAELESYLAALHYSKSKIDPDCVIMRTSDRFRERSFGFIDGSYHDVASFIHYYATIGFISRGRIVQIINYAHGSTAFISWHRLWLLFYERQIQKCTKNPDFALAYWKWEDDPDCAICDNKYIGANGWDGGIDKLSVFSQWRTICAVNYPNTVCVMNECTCERPLLSRLAGLAGFTKATFQEADECNNKTNVDTAPWDATSVDSFRGCLEDMHNRVHLYIGGTMSQVPISSNDPCFSLHHTNVDRMAERYFIKFGITPASYPTENNIYGHTASSCIIPFNGCWRNRDMFQRLTFFGADYV